MTVYMTLSGDKELLAALDKLPMAVGGKVIKNAIRAGGRQITKAAKEKAPLGPTGNLRKGIGTKLVVYQGDETAVLMVGVNFRKAPHAHLVEYGHGGPQPAPPHPFLRPAFDAAKATALAKIEKSFRSGIKRETKKLAKCTAG